MGTHSLPSEVQDSMSWSCDLASVPSAWLVGGCLAVVAWFAESASVLWIVRVQTEVDQFFA